MLFQVPPLMVVALTMLIVEVFVLLCSLCKLLLPSVAAVIVELFDLFDRWLAHLIAYLCVTVSTCLTRAGAQNLNEKNACMGFKGAFDNIVYFFGLFLGPFLVSTHPFTDPGVLFTMY